MAQAVEATGIQQEIAAIEQQLAQKRAELQSQQESGVITEMPHEKEMLREIMAEKINPGALAHKYCYQSLSG